MVTRSTLESGISMLSADPTLRIENSLFKKLEIHGFRGGLRGEGRRRPTGKFRGHLLYGKLKGN